MNNLKTDEQVFGLKKGQAFSPFEDEYGYYMDENGNETFGKVGKHNVMQDIRAQKDSTDMSFIMTMILKGDSADDLSASPDSFGDVSNLPDFFELQDRIKEGQEFFNSLPKAIKDKYDGQFGKFVFNFTAEDFAAKKEEKKQEEMKNVDEK